MKIQPMLVACGLGVHRAQLPDDHRDAAAHRAGVVAPVNYALVRRVRLDER